MQVRLPLWDEGGWECNLMVILQLGRVIIELPLPGKRRSILNSTSLSRDLRFHETSKPKLAHQGKQKYVSNGN